MSIGSRQGQRAPWTRRPRALAAGVLLAVLATGLAGCVSPRDTLGTNSSPCFRAVPVASDAVHDRGSLAGVRLMGPPELDRYPRLRDELASRVGRVLHDVCVVSFHGEFRHDEVERPMGRGPAGGTGPVAVVIVSYPQNALVGTFVLTREPLPLRHLVLGRLPTSPVPERPSVRPT